MVLVLVKMGLGVVMMGLNLKVGNSEIIVNEKLGEDNKEIFQAKSYAP
jgi:hypothetical protein